MNKKTVIITEIQPYAFTDVIRNKMLLKKELFTDVINKSKKWKDINIKATINCSDTYEKTIQKINTYVDKLLTYNYTPKLNLIVDATKSKIKTFKSFYEIIQQWFIMRKRLYKEMYFRDLMIAELRLFLINELARFIYEIDDTNILKLKDKKQFCIYMQENGYKRMSSSTISQAHKYKSPKELEHDWFNAKDVDYSYIMKNPLEFLHSRDYVKQIKQATLNLNEIKSDVVPFHYAKKWKGYIKIIEDVYNDKVDKCWLK